MKINQYLKKYKMHPKEFAGKCLIGDATVYRIKNGKAPTLRIAKRIELKTKGEITIWDLLGDDYVPSRKTKKYLELRARTDKKL